MQNLSFFSIGIYPHLQAISLECAAQVYPTLEKRDLRSKLSESQNIKNEVAAFVEHMVLEKDFQPSLLCIMKKAIFFFGKKSIEFRQIQIHENEDDNPQSGS
jgi:hypothetical protein